MKDQRQVPPIIQDMLDKLGDQSLNIWVRDNYAASLERVRDVCDAAVRRFHSEKFRKIDQKQKRRA